MMTFLTTAATSGVMVAALLAVPVLAARFGMGSMNLLVKETS